MPQQYNYEESCHQLLCQCRFRISCKTIALKALLALQGLAIVKRILYIAWGLSMVYLFICHIHDLWLRLLLHYLGDVLVISRSSSKKLIALTSVIRLVIERWMIATIFTALPIPSLIASIESLHITMLALSWDIYRAIAP